MPKITIRLDRCIDREPDDHVYGEPFDTAVDTAIGGAERWSVPRHVRGRTPAATLGREDLRVELHEFGPVFDFLCQHADQIPDYVGAISELVGAWAAVRQTRRAALPKDDARRASGASIQIAHLHLHVDRDVSAPELRAATEKLAELVNGPSEPPH